MKNHLKVSSAILGIAIFATAITISGLAFSTNDQPISTTGSYGFMGHVTLVVYDQDGNIKKYMQGDNKITNLAENCLAERLFGVTVASCVDTPGSVLDVGIGTGTGGGVYAVTALVATTTVITSTDVTLFATSTGETNISKAVVDIVRTFTTPGAAVYSEAGLFDATGNMYARQEFGTLATLGADDNITVSWRIDLGPNA